MTADDRPSFLLGIQEQDQLSPDEYEDNVRRKLANDLKLAIEAQTEFFSSWESPLARSSSRNLELIIAIAERFLESPELVTEDWPFPSESMRRTLMDAQILEIIRRTILQPTDILINVKHEVISTPTIFSYDEDGFFKRRSRLVTNEMLTCRQEGVREADKERVANVLKERSVEEWEEIAQLEDRFLTEFLQGVLNDQVQPEVEKLLELLQYGDITPDARAKFAALEKIAPLLYERDLEGLQKTIKDVLGENANFRTFVQIL